MKLIDSKVEYLPQENGIEGIYKMIEVAGRTAYQSLDKITDDSAKGFVDRMIKSKHGAALEHGTVYLKVPVWDAKVDFAYQRYFYNPYSKTEQYLKKLGWANRDEDCIYVVTNYRVVAEKNYFDDLQYLCTPTEFHEKRYTMRFTCSRAIAQELTRHKLLCAA